MDDTSLTEQARRLFAGRVEFLKSAPSLQFLPDPDVPEIAFAGRSNAGKSSAINTLVGHTRLAFVSKTPGRTQLINVFRMKNGAALVDAGLQGGELGLQAGLVGRECLLEDLALLGVHALALGAELPGLQPRQLQRDALDLRVAPLDRLRLRVDALALRIDVFALPAPDETSSMLAERWAVEVQRRFSADTENRPAQPVKPSISPPRWCWARS